MVEQLYELTFKGEAGAAVQAAFREFDISAAHGTTILRGHVADQAALHGVIDRIRDLALELIDVRLVVDGDEHPGSEL